MQFPSPDRLMNVVYADSPAAFTTVALPAAEAVAGALSAATATAKTASNLIS
jgi:hypothetical protein